MGKYLKSPNWGLKTTVYLLPILVSSTVVIAQESAQDDSIEEIVIRGSYTTTDKLDTATGLGLTLQETPQSVSVITSQRIIDQGLTNLTDIINNAPGVSSKAYDSSRNAFSARGFDVDNYQLDGIPMHWDGSASSGETQTDASLFERVEIVRGATGLLTGAGNPSASINLVRKRADSENYSGYVSASVSRWNTYHVSVDMSTPLNSDATIRGRTVLAYEDGDSFVDYAGNTKTVIYGVVDADLSLNTVISVGASYQNNDPTASQWGGLPIFFSDGTRTNFSRSDTIGANWTYWDSNNQSIFATLDHEFANGWELKLHLNRTESESDMRLLYLFGSPDPITGLGMGAFPAGYAYESTQDDIGFRINGSYDLFNRGHELVLGYTQNEKDVVYAGLSATSTAPVGNIFEWDGSYPEPDWIADPAFQDDTTEQSGYFAATRFNLSEKFKLIAGTRIANWDRTSEFDDKYGDDGIFVPYSGVLYDIAENHTLYLSYTEIFKPQSAKDRNGRYLDPVVGKNKEIGLKSAFFDDVLHTTITYFDTLQDNIALPDPGFFIPGTITEASRPGKGVESDGFELEVTGHLSNAWAISANYTQFDATAESTTGGGANTVNTRFPRKLLNLFTSYNWHDLTIGAGINWEGENYTDVENPATFEMERAKQESYALVNLMARYQIYDQLSVQLNIDNLLDETYYSQIGFYTQLAFGEPRNITLQMKYDF